MKRTNIKPDPELDRLNAERRAAEKAALLAHGRPNVRHVNSRGVYVFYSGRHYVVTGQSFDFEADAWQYLKDTHGIERPDAKPRRHRKL